jgi:2-aminoadipate transaminase
MSSRLHGRAEARPGNRAPATPGRKPPDGEPAAGAGAPDGRAPAGAQGFDRFFSTAAAGMTRSVIRELLKFANRPELISFAGGLPHPGTFPARELAQICAELLEYHPNLALQYGTTEGLTALRELLRDFLRGQGLELGQEELIVSSASQQSLDLLGKILLDPGDRVVVENPSYLGAISAFRSYGARFLTVEMDEQGLLTGELARELAGLRRAGQPMPKFLYTVPDFQNPTGITLSAQRRRELLDVAGEHDLLIVEDVPYRWIRFRGEAPPMIAALERERNPRADALRRVISVYTFSKILAPGLRLGWITADARIVDRLVQAKQATDLCTAAFTQMLAEQFIRRGLLSARIRATAELYGRKMEVMRESLEEMMPKAPGLCWTVPEGGMFLWLVLPPALDAEEMFAEALQRNVAYVIGSAFHANGGGRNTMRLNFSYPSREEIREGISRLAGLVRSRLEAGGPG